jgi:hypothetical protein
LTRELDIFRAYLGDREIAFGLTEKHAREAAQDSCWVEESDEVVTISASTILVHEIDAELKYGEPDDANHVLWRCPVCDSWLTEDYFETDKPPTLAICGYGRKHPDGKDVWVLMHWSPPGRPGSPSGQ